MDLLYHDGERVYEAASASVYFVRDGPHLRPRGQRAVGNGRLARARAGGGDYEVVTGDIALGDALAADEAFLTSTTRGVVPIVRLDETLVGDGMPGPITRDLMARWRGALRARLGARRARHRRVHKRSGETAPAALLRDAPRLGGQLDAHDRTAAVPVDDVDATTVRRDERS